MPGTSEERETAFATGASAAAPIDVHGSQDSSSDDDFNSLVQRSKVSMNGDPLKQTGEDLLDSESEELPIRQRSGILKAAPKGKQRRRKTPSNRKPPPRAKEVSSPKESSEEEDLADSESESEDNPDQQRTRRRQSASKRQTRKAKQAPSRNESSEEEDTHDPARRGQSKKGNEFVAKGSKEDTDEGPLTTRKRKSEAKSKQTPKGAHPKGNGGRRQSKELDDEFLSYESEEEEYESEDKQNVDEREEDFDPDDDEEEALLTTRKGESNAQGRQTRKGAQSKGHRSRRQSKDSDDEFIVKENEEDEYESEDKQSDDESEEDFDPDNDEEEAPLTTRKRKSKAQAVQTRRGSKSKRETPSRASARKAAQSLAELDDDEEPVFNGRRRSKRSRDDDDFNVDEFNVDEGGDSEDHDAGDSEVDSPVESSGDNEESTLAPGRYQSPASQRQSPSRAAALKASQKLAILKDNADDEDVEVVTVRNTRRRSKKRSDDDAYEENESEESEEDLDDMASDKSPPHDDQSSQGDEDQVKKSKAVEVGNDFGTVDDSSSDDEKWASPQLKLKPSPGVLQLDRDDDSEDDNSGPSNTLSPPKIPVCPSKYDVITEEKLPRKHVCYFSPDGSHRQCFALETLHKIALTTPHPKFRQDLTGGKQTFLQPPHFRSEMSDDLLDQIASRFGREALDLRSSFYSSSRRESAGASSEDDDSEYIVNYSEALADSINFLERVGNYVQSQMGSQDVRILQLVLKLPLQVAIT
jgi:hypothetical protein